MTLTHPPAPRCRALVITVGQQPEPQPWWWDQLASWSLRESLVYERISIDNLPQKQLGLRHMPAFIGRLMKLLRRARRERMNYVLTFEADLTCYMIGFLQLLPWFRGPKHVILQFITRERAPTASSRLRHAIAQLCLSTVYRFICSSRREVEYYRSLFPWDPARFVFVPFHTDERLLARPSAPRADFIIAAGRAYRDFATLAQAVAGTGIRTLIVCGRQGPQLDQTPPEVTVITEMPFDQLMGEVARARVVVVPLTPQRISTGQSFVLQAMAVRGAVVATRTAGTEDYIEDGVNGLLVSPRDPAELRRVIQRVWNDSALATELGESARATIVRKHLPAEYARTIAAAIATPPDASFNRE
jgi:glycosyltransferase involved in cell wall biosynthesis